MEAVEYLYGNQQTDFLLHVFNLDEYKIFVLSSYLYVNCLMKSVGIVSYLLS